jgi:hypothetical protein
MAHPVLKAPKTRMIGGPRPVRTKTKNVGKMGKRCHQPERKILIEQQFHTAENSLCSRWAANASVAKISSWCRSVESARISSSVILLAKYSKISDTVMRVPQMMGFPLRTAGLIVIRSNNADISDFLETEHCRSISVAPCISKRVVRIYGRTKGCQE